MDLVFGVLTAFDIAIVAIDEMLSLIPALLNCCLNTGVGLCLLDSIVWKLADTGKGLLLVDTDPSMIDLPSGSVCGVTNGAA